MKTRFHSFPRMNSCEIILMLFAFSSAAWSQVIIQGTVKAAMDQSAVPNALVELVNLDIKGVDTARVMVNSAFTNQNGEFLFQVTSTVQKNELIAPNVFYLSSTYPNPFSDATQIDFSVQKQDIYSISIYNVLGQIVASFQNTLSPGCYSIHWQGAKLSGMYFGLIRSGNGKQSFKLVQLTTKAEPSKISVAKTTAISPLRKQLQPSDATATGSLQLYVSRTDFQIFKTQAMEYQNKTLDIYLQTGENVSGILADIDGNVYKTIKIGQQWWMAENLKVTRYRNGDAISKDRVCSFRNDETNVHAYGRLYNWFAVNDSRGLPPVGWHVPSEMEWQILVDFLGGNSMAGGKMKEGGVLHWSSPNLGASNESGFGALPGGYRWGSQYMDLLYTATFWSSTENSYMARTLRLDFVSTMVNYDDNTKSNCYSVRCVKD